MNTPHDLIGNDQRKEVMQQYRTRIDDGILEEEEEPIRFLPSRPPRVLKTPQVHRTQRKVSASPLSRKGWVTL